MFTLLDSQKNFENAIQSSKMSVITKVGFFTYTRTWSNQLLKILLINIFSNHSDFCFHIPILDEILGKKSLYGRKNFISEKKIITKNFEKNNFFQSHYCGGTMEELFAYIFGIYKKFGGNNLSILAPSDSVAVTTQAE